MENYLIYLIIVKMLRLQLEQTIYVYHSIISSFILVAKVKIQYKIYNINTLIKCTYGKTHHFRTVL